MKFIVCEHCGASLDFGEKCDCLRLKELQKNELSKSIEEEKSGQLKLIDKE